MLGRGSRAKLLRKSFIAFDHVAYISKCREVENRLMLGYQVRGLATNYSST
jgi:hypothetical protein